MFIKHIFYRNKNKKVIVEFLIQIDNREKYEIHSLIL